jgi:radical SAM superfamily enzyme YgiQ (UPF0313 family)
MAIHSETMRRDNLDGNGTRRQKILLVAAPTSAHNPKTAFVPLVHLVLGTCLKKLQCQTVLDFDYDLIDLDLALKRGELEDGPRFYDQAMTLLEPHQADIYFFTTHGANTVVVLQLAQRLKQASHDCVIVLGGVAATLQAQELVENFPQIDAIVKGAAEPAMLALVTQALGEKDFSRVPGAVSRQGGQVVEARPSSCANHILNAMEVPDYSLVDLQAYIDHNKKHPYIDPGFTLVEPGRGCPYNCSFCAPKQMWQREVQYRPIPEIIAEMKFLAERGLNFTFFTKDNIEEEFVLEFSEALIRENSNISWGCYARLDRLSVKAAEIMGKSGCRLIFAGFETSNIVAQKSMRKVVNRSDNMDRVTLFNQHGIKILGSFIAGFDGETAESLNRTFIDALEVAAGKPLAEIQKAVRSMPIQKCLETVANFGFVHPLAYMPGTDTYKEARNRLRFTEHPNHHDSFGSYLFGLNDFVREHWRTVINPFVTHLPEEKVRYYHSTLRVFNFLNARPYLLAAIISPRQLDARNTIRLLFSDPRRFFSVLQLRAQRTPLALARYLVLQLGEDVVLHTGHEQFEQLFRDYFSRLFGTSAQLTAERRGGTKTETSAAPETQR